MNRYLLLSIFEDWEGGGGIPAAALLDEAGDGLLDEVGDFLLEE